jgi:peptide/nickel transport system substrate-binding protein
VAEVEGLRTYDPAKAKALLAEAGYPTGFKTQLIARNTDDRDMIVSVQTDMKGVGINAELVLVDSAKYGELRQKGWDGVFMCGSGIISNYGRALDLYFRKGSTELFSIARPEGFQEAIEAAITTKVADPVKVKAAAKFLFDQAMWIPTHHHGDNYAYDAKVNGLNFGSYGQWGAFDAEKVWISK